MFGFKKKHEKLIDEVKSAVTKFREFSLEHPEIPSTYTMEGFENILKDLENVKKVIDQKLVFDEGKKSPEKKLMDSAAKDYSQNGFLQETVYAQIEDSTLRNELEAHYREIQKAVINLLKYINVDYKPNISKY